MLGTSSFHINKPLESVQALASSNANRKNKKCIDYCSSFIKKVKPWNTNKVE